MSNQINLSKEELTDYLTEIDKAEHFAGWLSNKRGALTLDSLLAAPASAKPAKATRTTTGDAPQRGELEKKFKAFMLTEPAYSDATVGASLEAITSALHGLEKGDADYPKKKNATRNWLTGKAFVGEVAGKTSTFYYIAPAAPETAPAGEATAPATKPAKKGNK